MTLPEEITRGLGEATAHPSICFRGSWWSWADVADLAANLKSLVSNLGLDFRAGVGVLLRNGPAQFACLVGVMANGGRLVSLSALLPDQALCEQLAALQLPVVIGARSDWARPGLREAAVAAGTTCVSIDSDSSAVWSQSLKVLSRGDARHNVPTEADFVALDLPTSGTTGPPKRIALTYKDLEGSLESTVALVSNAGGARRSRPPSPAVISTPLSHIGGCWYAIQSALQGRTVGLLERFEPTEWADIVSRIAPRVVGLTPTGVRMILSADVPELLLASLRAVTVGTAPLPREVQIAFENRYKIPVLPQYGATEFAGPIIGWSMPDYKAFRDTKLGSAGRAYPGMDLRVVDTEGFQPVSHGHPGLLEIRRIRSEPAEWKRTTDIVVIDDDGFVWVRGRADDAINRGGFKISTRKIVQALEQHPVVQEAAVVGLSEPRLGAVPAAAVVLASAPAAETPDPADLVEWTRARLLPYEVPVKVVILDAMPRTSTQKISLSDVRALIEPGAMEPPT